MSRYKEAKRQEYLKEIIQLYANGKLNDDGALIEYSQDIEKAMDRAIEALKSLREIQVEINALGFNYGHSSFIDLVVHAKSKDLDHQLGLGSRGEAQTKEGVFVYLCLYQAIYVIGGIVSGSSGPAILPSLSSVDSFYTQAGKTICSAVTPILKSVGWVRAYADELDTSLEDNMKINSNLVESKLTVFDAYFNWID